jgi:ribosomal protein L37AE/L43A
MKSDEHKNYKKKKVWEPNIICDKCGYQNHKRFVDIYGTCHLCGNVLNKKAKYEYEMVKRLYLWRGKDKKGRKYD